MTEENSNKEPVASEGAAEVEQVVESVEESVKESVEELAESEAAEVAGNYLAHVKKVITQPDEYFNEDQGASLQLGLINLAIFLILNFFYMFVVQVTRLSSWSIKFSHFTTGLRTLLVIGVPLVVAVFALRWMARDKNRSEISTGFIVEKLGAILIVPSLLLVAATALALVNFDLYAWLRGLALVLVWAGIFLVSYLYGGGKTRIRNAFLFTAAFYLAYRLMQMLL